MRGSQTLFSNQQPDLKQKSIFSDKLILMKENEKESEIQSEIEKIKKYIQILDFVRNRNDSKLHIQYYLLATNLSAIFVAQKHGFCNGAESEQEVLKYYALAITGKPKEPEYLFSRADFYLALGQNKNANADFQKAKKLKISRALHPSLTRTLKCQIESLLSHTVATSPPL